MQSVSETVCLRGGFVIPVEAVVLALDLESRGCFIEADGDGLLVGPPDRVTVDDCRAIRAHKQDLLRLVHYCETGGVQ